MSSRLNPGEVLDHHYLEVRCKLLEIAAILDRFQRAGGGDPAGSSEPRLERCSRALGLLAQPSETPDRAERIALIFSNPD
jgi:hypothetical protein